MAGPGQGNTPNTLLTPQWVTNTTMANFRNALRVLPHVNREYDKEFAQKGKKIGSQLEIRKPVQFVGRRGPGAQIEAINEQFTTLTITTQYGVDMEASSFESALDLDFIEQRYLRPAAINIANAVDTDILALALSSPNIVGVPGTAISTNSTFLAAKTALDNAASPVDDDRTLIVDSNTESTAVSLNLSLFNPQQNVAKQFTTGRLTNAFSFDWYMDQNTNMATTGPLGGTPKVNGANQTGSNLITDGWTAAAALRLNAGDHFTVDGVFAVNPVSRQSTGKLAQFVATAAVSSDGTGAATIPIYPPITVTGPYQTVTVSPADNANINVVGPANTTYSQNLAFHKDSITFASVELPMPRESAWCGMTYDPDLNLSIRVTKQWNVLTDIEVIRLDLLAGMAMIRPEWSVVVANS